MFSELVDKVQFHLIRGQLFLTNSQVLFNKYGSVAANGEIIKTTTLFKEDFLLKKFHYDNNKPLKLLYVGRIDYSKGILEIIEACALLVQHGIDIELNLVGAFVNNIPPVELEIRRLFSEAPLKGKIVYHGTKKVGQELFSIYRECHLFVLASKSEGFPRVIWEAFANSLPVVCTKVGSIPAFLTDRVHAMLLDNQSPEGIYSHIRYIIDNQDFTNRLIQNAYRLVIPNTLEAQSQQIYEALYPTVKAQRN